MEPQTGAPFDGDYVAGVVPDLIRASAASFLSWRLESPANRSMRDSNSATSVSVTVTPPLDDGRIVGPTDRPRHALRRPVTSSVNSYLRTGRECT